MTTELRRKEDALRKELKELDERRECVKEALLALAHVAKPRTPRGLGYCPICGEPGLMRERRPNGDDKCTKGHSYPSSTALAFKEDFHG